MSSSSSAGGPIADAHAGMLHGLELARSALNDVLKRITEYDSQFVGVGEKAGPYVKSAVEMGQNALDELARIVDNLKSGTTEFPIKAVTVALTKANAAFTHLMEVASEYDSKYAVSTRLSTVVARPGEQAALAVATIGAYAATASAQLHAQLQGVTDALHATLNATKDKLEVTSVDAGTMVVEKVKELDERFGLSGMLGAAVTPVQSLDQKVTGGKVSSAVISAYNAGYNMIVAFNERLSKKRKVNQ